MNIYISGITGTGMGPLALMAKQAGHNVFGSDISKGAIYDELVKAGIDVFIGEQNGIFLNSKLKTGVDWFAYTSALPEKHAELVMARNAGVRCTKRDDLTAFLVSELGLKMVAVAGTHGKTTTTAMIIWMALKLGLPVSYVVGTTLGFAPSGAYHTGDRYFIYEADEYDRNFLKFHPWLSVITVVSYDHPDIYPTESSYKQAFLQFETQSKKVIREGMEAEFKLAGEVRRKDAGLASAAISLMIKDNGGAVKASDKETIVEIINQFPGVGRRFEKLAEGVYTDYAHHPEEVQSTIGVAKDELAIQNKKGIVVVYEPHQNTRQHQIMDEYADAFLGVDKVFWLPTYLTREDPELKVIRPEDFIQCLSNGNIAEEAELDSELEKKLKEYLKKDYLVLLMTAGPADSWFREKFCS